MDSDPVAVQIQSKGRLSAGDETTRARARAPAEQSKHPKQSKPSKHVKKLAKTETKTEAQKKPRQIAARSSSFDEIRGISQTPTPRRERVSEFWNNPDGSSDRLRASNSACIPLFCIKKEAFSCTHILPACIPPPISPTAKFSANRRNERSFATESNATKS